MSTLILIANGMEARMLSSAWRARPRELYEVARLSRAAGKRAQPAARAGAAADHDGQAADLHRFARRISRQLDTIRRNLGYDDLIVIAAPKFLGTLRSTLRGVTRNLVSREISRDLIHAEERQIRAVAFD